MTTKVKKWGNSLGLRLPNKIAQQLDIKDGSNIKFNLKDNSIEITKVDEEITLDSLLSKINQNNIHSEISENNKIGNEIW